MHNIQPEDQAEDKMSTVSPSESRPWVKPALERLPLKDALTGRASNGPFPDGQNTYPSR
jgi:hypothetical protein